MIRPDLGTNMEDIIRGIGYDEIRTIFEDIIEEEVTESYEKGVDDGREQALEEE